MDHGPFHAPLFSIQRSNLPHSPMMLYYPTEDRIMDDNDGPFVFPHTFEGFSSTPQQLMASSSLRLSHAGAVGPYLPPLQANSAGEMDTTTTLSTLSGGHSPVSHQPSSPMSDFFVHDQPWNLHDVFDQGHGLFDNDLTSDFSVFGGSAWSSSLPAMSFPEKHDSLVTHEEYSPSTDFTPVSSLPSLSATPDLPSFKHEDQPQTSPIIHTPHQHSIFEAKIHREDNEDEDLDEVDDTSDTGCHDDEKDATWSARPPRPRAKHNNVTATRSRGRPRGTTRSCKITKADTKPRKPRVLASDTVVVACSTTSDPVDDEIERLYPCLLMPYGCTSDFKAKNEWKRHIQTKHILLEWYNCSECTKPEGKAHKFNREDLYVAHLLRMHLQEYNQDDSTPVNNKQTRTSPNKFLKAAPPSPDSMKSKSRKKRSPELVARLEEILPACWNKGRHPPRETTCISCNETFVGENSHLQWLEHVGQHLGRPGADLDIVAWTADTWFGPWLVENGLLVPSTTHEGAPVQGVGKYVIAAPESGRRVGARSRLGQRSSGGSRGRNQLAAEKADAEDVDAEGEDDQEA